MAEPVVLNAWSAEGVKVADVLEALDDLRRSEQLSATRAAVMTLVIVARDGAAATRAANAVHELGGHHPARTLCLLANPEASPSLDAEVRLLTSEAEGHAIWSEDVQLVIGGPGARHLDSLIEPFTLADLPVVTWFVDELPDPEDPLLAAADVALVDARVFGDRGCFATIEHLTRICPVVDLSWTRLRPWRRLLAVLFDGREFRRYARAVRHAEIGGKSGPRHLLAGWLVDRLALPRSEIHLVEAEHVAIKLTGEVDGMVATFEVGRDGDRRALRAAASVVGGPATASMVTLPAATPAWGLAEALSRIERDPLYEHALRASLAL